MLRVSDFIICILVFCYMLALPTPNSIRKLATTNKDYPAVIVFARCGYFQSTFHSMLRFIVNNR